MPLFHLVILSLIQGITEFLPVSSSGHLVLAHTIMGDDNGMADVTMDVAVHVGTLMAVLVYFRRDIFKVARGGDNRLLFFVVAASVPVVIAGYFLHLFMPDWLRSVEVMAWCTLVFGVVLGLVDRYRPAERTLEQLTLKDALLIGLAQVLALLPGTSRSGITMTAARGLGFSRTESARFSLFLAIVAISGAGTLSGLDLIQAGDVVLTFNILIAIVLAFFTGWIAITLMMKWLEKASFMLFAVYRIVLGLILLAIGYSTGFNFILQ